LAAVAAAAEVLTAAVAALEGTAILYRLIYQRQRTQSLLAAAALLPHPTRQQEALAQLVAFRNSLLLAAAAAIHLPHHQIQIQEAPLVPVVVVEVGVLQA
jgi:hypothetical protein